MLIVLFIIIWKSTQNRKAKASILDRLLAQFKILLGFYQVIGAMFSAMQNIHWPDKLAHIASSMNVFEMNLLKVFVKPSCYSQGLKFNAYNDFVIALCFVGFVCLVAVLWYTIRVVYLHMKFGLSLHCNIYTRDTKMRCLVFTIVALFITYPSVCSVTLELLPTGCDKFSLDEYHRYYVRRLRADYSIDCDKDIHQSYTSAAYAALVCIVGFPVFLFLLLWKHRQDIHEMKASMDTEQYRDKSVQACQANFSGQLDENEGTDLYSENIAAHSINVNVQDIDNNNGANNEGDLQDGVDDVNFEIVTKRKKNNLPGFCFFARTTKLSFGTGKLSRLHANCYKFHFLPCSVPVMPGIFL